MNADLISQEQENLLNQLNSIQEKILLLQRYQELSQGDAVAAVKPLKKTPVKAPVVTNEDMQNTGEKRGRGRPKGSGKKQVENQDSTDEDKKIDLPSLLENIGQEVDRPLDLADFVKLVLETGYQSKAKDFSSMVYQSLRKLTKSGKFVKNDKTRCYEFVSKVA